MELVDAVGEYLLLDLSGNAAACGNGLKLYAEFVGQLASFGEEFEGDFLYRVFVYFAVYEYVVDNLSILNKRVTQWYGCPTILLRVPRRQRPMR